MIVSKGIRIRDEADILENIIGDLSAEFPNMSKESNNALIVLAKVLSREISNNENNRLEAYNNAYVATSIGLHLDKAVQTVGLSRVYGTSSYGVCTFTKDSKVNKVVIPPNTPIESGDLQFVTLNTSFITIPPEGVDIEVKSSGAGTEYNLPKESTFTPVIDIRGLKEIKNKKEFLGGTDTETDQALRARYYQFINSFSNSSLNGIISEVSRLEDVTRVSGRENNTDVEFQGLPPHSFELYVEGSTTSIIADKIFRTKPAGIQTHGDVSHTISYENNDYEIKFSRFDRQNVFYSIELRTVVGASTSEIEQQIIETLKVFTSSNKTINHSEVVGALYNNIKGIAAITKLFFGLKENPKDDKELVSDVGTVFFTDDSKIDVSFVVK